MFLLNKNCALPATYQTKFEVFGARRVILLRERSFVVNFLLAVGLVVYSIGWCYPVSAASWKVIHQTKFGDWEATYNKNNRTEEFFCSSETSSSDGSVFRINFYKSGNGNFIEFFNPEWNLIEGPARFGMVFDNGYSLELRGKAYSDSYTHDLIEKDNMFLLFGLLTKSLRFELTNANGTAVSKFSLSGSKDALRAMNACAGGT